MTMKLATMTMKHFAQYCILSLSLHHMSSDSSKNHLVLVEVVELCLEEFCYHPLATFQTSSSPAHQRKDPNTSLFRCRHLCTCWECLISCKNLSKSFLGMLRRSPPTLEGEAFSVSSFSFSTLVGFAFVPASASSLMNLNGGFT